MLVGTQVPNISSADAGEDVEDDSEHAVGRSHPPQALQLASVQSFAVLKSRIISETSKVLPLSDVRKATPDRCQGAFRDFLCIGSYPQQSLAAIRITMDPPLTMHLPLTGTGLSPECAQGYVRCVVFTGNCASFRTNDSAVSQPTLD